MSFYLLLSGKSKLWGSTGKRAASIKRKFKLPPFAFVTVSVSGVFPVDRQAQRRQKNLFSHLFPLVWHTLFHGGLTMINIKGEKPTMKAQT